MRVTRGLPLKLQTPRVVLPTESAKSCSVCSSTEVCAHDIKYDYITDFALVARRRRTNQWPPNRSYALLVGPRHKKQLRGL